MARTAPVPNIPPIPGMCPSVAVLGGGADGGGAHGGGGQGNGNADGSGGGSGENATPDGRNAQSGSGCGGGQSGCPNHHAQGSGTASRGDPVDVVTGRVFTDPVIDLELAGPLPLSISRSYSTGAADRDVGLGHGWSHSLAWEIQVLRRSTRVWKGDGTAVELGPMSPGDGSVGLDGCLLIREGAGFILQTASGLMFIFSGSEDATRYRLSALQDRWGNRITLTYQGKCLSEITDSVGRVVRVTSTAEGRIGAFEVKNAPSQGRWIAFARYAYDSRGDLTSATDADGHVTSYTYDDDHLLTSYAAPTGLVFYFEYDGARRCVETWGEYPDKEDPSLAASVPALLADHTTRAKGIHHCKLEYHADGYSEVVDSVTVQRFFGNRFGKIDKSVSAGGVYTRSYDQNGQLLSFTDPLQATTTWERDVRGRETKIIDPLGRTTQIEREPDGHIRAIIDPQGGVTEISRSADGLVWTDPIGAVFQVKMDPRGLITETVAPNGARTRCAYDAHGNLVERVDASGATFRLTYDYFGRCTSLCDPLAAVTSYAYSPRGDLIAVRAPDGVVTQYVYDGAGYLTSLTRPGGQTTRIIRGGLNKLCRVVSPNGGEISFKYDREGRLVEIHNEQGEVHTFTLEAGGLVVGERTFDGRSISYGYDLAGRLTYVENGARERTEYVYDLAGQLLERTYADGGADVFAYDLRGQLTSAKGSGGEFLFERNAVGWVVKETQVVAGDAVSVEVAYDLMGAPVRRSTSLGHTTEWIRDARGCSARIRLDGADEIVLAHDALGREERRTLPRGGRIEKAYDAVGRLVRQRVLSPTQARRMGPNEPDWVGPIDGNVSAEQAYRYSSASELAEAWDQAHGLKRFEYDPAGQLLAAISDMMPSEHFRYNETGNVFGAEPRRYGPGNRLIRKADTDYLWDDEGRLKETRARASTGGERVTRYRWRTDGLLGSVERPDGCRVEFDYDPFARRVMKRLVRTDDSSGAQRVAATTRFVWDGGVPVHEIKSSADEAGEPLVDERTYVFEEGGAVPFAQRDVRRRDEGALKGEWLYYCNDHLGAPVRLVDAAGAVAGEIARTAWGRATAASPNGASTPLRFLGQYADEETGLAYNRHRYYDPDTGRYISPDPIGVYGGLNGFSYAENSPTGRVDPDGLMPYSIIRDPSGRIVHVANSAANLPGGTAVQPLNPAIAGGVTRSSCSEVAALNMMAGTIRANDPQGVRDTMRQRFQQGWTIETRTGSAPTPQQIAAGQLTGQQMAPCPRCAQFMRNLGIHPCNLDNGRTTTPPPSRGVLGPNSMRARDDSTDPMGRPPRWQGNITQGNEDAASRRRGDPTQPPNVPGWTNHG